VNYGSDGAEPYNRVYTRKLFEHEILQPRLSGTTSLNTNILYEIKPRADFDRVEVRSYFNNPHGIYYFPTTTYTPRYRNPLSVEWDGSTFVGAATWSYGQQFKFNDVVYQEVTHDSQFHVLGSLTSSAVAGNGKYYVFATRPSYSQPTDGTSFHSGSVPSYIPPSLDRGNWRRLRFRPIEKRLPKRIVFDTFVYPDPASTNYKTTTIDIDRIIDTPDRYVDLISAGTISAGGYTTGEMALQNISILFALQSNNEDFRIRLYRTKTQQLDDISRPVNVYPSASAGVLLDSVITDKNVVELINPFVTLVADESPPLGKIFYPLNNYSLDTKIDVNRSEEHTSELQ
jgi:hypothetical protein